MIFLVSAQAWATEPSIPCTIIDCPEKYMPVPPGKPDATGLGKVNLALGASRTAKTQEELARNAWQKSQRELQTMADDTPAEERRDKIKEFVSKASALREAMRAKRRAYDHAIWETAIAYKIVPPVVDPGSDERLQEPWRRVSAWNPQFGEDEIWDKQKKKWRPRDIDDLKKQKFENERKAAGLGLGVVLGTADGHTNPKDGSIQIFDDAFDDPERLAATIFHETSHWIDAVRTHGEYPSLAQRYDSEQRAYSRQADFLDKIGKSGAADRAVARQYAWQASTIRREHLTENDIKVKPEYRNWLQGSFHGGESGRPEPSRESAEDEFYKDIAKGAEVAQHAREIGFELMRQENRKRLFDGLMHTALMACSTPDLVNQQSIDELPFSDALTDYDLAPGYSHPVFGGGDSCPARVYRAMVAELRSGRKLREGWVIRFGRQVIDDYEVEAAESERRKNEEEALAKLKALAAEYSFGVDDFLRDGEILFRDVWSDPRFGRVYGFKFKYMNEARAGLFLARTCLDAAVGDPRDRALDTLRRNAAAEDFHARLLPTYSDPVYDCIRALIEYPDSLGSPEQIGKILEWHHKRVKKAEEALRRQEERSREAREREQRERRPRDSNEADTEERRRGNLDLSPAERALDRARESVGRGLRRR